MITNIFLKLTDVAIFRRWIWKPVYELLAKAFKDKDWSLMNYGYAAPDGEPLLTLDIADEINRYSIQMYYSLTAGTVLPGADILEVGSGRGGGADFIKRYGKPLKITGVDIAVNAVKMANENFGGEGISFIQASAEKLSFADESFDVVINVESSHAYGSVPCFLYEAKRVLRKGGHLLLADIRTAAGMHKLEQQLKTCGLQLLSEENISLHVTKAIELEDVIKRKRIKQIIPASLQKIFNEFAGIVGSKAHTQLLSGELIYKRFVLVKTGHG